jgi:hypothetical protein
MKRLVRLLSRWAWDDFLFDVGRVEWKYGRMDSGAPKDWDEWNNVRDGLRDAGRLRAPWELDKPNDPAEVRKSPQAGGSADQPKGDEK